MKKKDETVYRKEQKDGTEEWNSRMEQNDETVYRKEQKDETVG